MKNGGTILFSDERTFTVADIPDPIPLSFEVDLEIDDEITLEMRKLIGGNVDLLFTTNYMPYFSIIRLGASI